MKILSYNQIIFGLILILLSGPGLAAPIPLIGKITQVHPGIDENAFYIKFDATPANPANCTHDTGNFIAFESSVSSVVSRNFAIALASYSSNKTIQINVSDTICLLSYPTILRINAGVD